MALFSVLYIRLLDVCNLVSGEPVLRSLKCSCIQHLHECRVQENDQKYQDSPKLTPRSLLREGSQSLF